jgi:hypothetical protein
MSVSQRTVFVGQDSRPNPGDNLGLWTTTGTTPIEGVALAGPPGGGIAPSVQGIAALPGSLVLASDNEVAGPLFVTDPATGLFSELAVLPGASPNDLVSAGPLVLFNGGSGAGNALFRTDGTAAGTVAVPVPAAPAGLAPSNLYAFDGGALFTGYGADNDVDVYFTDGTAAGTREIAAFAPPVQQGINGGILNLVPPTASFDPIGTLGGRVVFAGPGPSGGLGLWSTDGTTAGTTPIATTDVSPTGPSILLGGRLLYAASFSNGAGVFQGLYATDGTAAGSVEVSALDSGPDAASEASGLTLLGNGAVFAVTTLIDDISTTSALWATDGTTVGTVPIVPGLYAAYITALGNGEAVFAGTISTGALALNPDGLYVTDGTAAGTREVVAGLAPTSITALANGTAEFASGGALYVTDGTAVGTRMVPGTAGLYPTSITVAPSPLAFTGTQAQYDLAPTAAGVLQTRDLSAGGATLALPEARVLTFGDGTTAVFDPSGNAEAVARIYLAAYGQAPDLAGLLAYTQQADAGTVSLAQIAAAAPVSAQFLAAGTLTDAQFVTKLYQNADGRAPDAGGLAAYTQALASGQTRGQVLLAIAESPEARVHSQSVAGNANDATITRLYEAIDARAPDASGLAGYASALDTGQSVAQIAAAMLASPEYAGRFGAPANAVFVTELYQNLLGRAPDAGGLAGYTAALAGGETRAQLVAGFVASDEARLATAPLTHLGYVSLR